MSSHDQVDPHAKTTDLIDDYTLGKELGRGTFAVVQEAVNRKTKAKVAVKTVDKRKHAKSIPLLQKEVQILKKLRGGVKVVNLIDVYEDRRSVFIVQELITGGELFDKIVAKGYYSEADGAAIVSAILQALVHVHSNNIVHRDLKPENLLCGDKEFSDLTDIKVIDFGIAEEVTRGTQVTGSVGSPSYVAPEIILGQPYGLEVDMWSLGVLSYVIMGGYLPFTKNGALSLNSQITNGKYEFHVPEWDEVGPTAKDFISKLLVVDPKKRMTVQQAVNHPFVASQENLKKSNLSASFTRFKEFNAARKLKGAAFAIVSAQKMIGALKPTKTEGAEHAEEGLHKIEQEELKANQNSSSSNSSTLCMDSPPSQSSSPRILFRYCTKCKWLLRTSWMATELLSSFETTPGAIGQIILEPISEPSAVFQIWVNNTLVWDRKRDQGFPEIAKLKSLVKDIVAPEKEMVHVDKAAGKHH